MGSGGLLRALEGIRGLTGRFIESLKTILPLRVLWDSICGLCQESVHIHLYIEKELIPAIWKVKWMLMIYIYFLIFRGINPDVTKVTKCQNKIVVLLIRNRTDVNCQCRS